jgi:hypothetical protein
MDISAKGQKTLDAEDDKGDPYETEADELGGRERLPVDEDAEEKLYGRGDILEDADHGKAYAPDSHGEHEERGRGYQPCAHEEHVRGRVALEERSAAAKPGAGQIDEGRQGQKTRFQGQPVKRSEGGRFS